MRISDWSSDVCSSDLLAQASASLGYINIYPDEDGVIRSLNLFQNLGPGQQARHFITAMLAVAGDQDKLPRLQERPGSLLIPYAGSLGHFTIYPYAQVLNGNVPPSTFDGKYVRSEEHTSEIQSLMSTSYDV